MRRKLPLGSTVVIAVVFCTEVVGSPPEAIPDSENPLEQVQRASDPATLILESLVDEDLRLLAREVLERNPGLAAARAGASAARSRTPQVTSLPDPMLTATWFAMSPQTRVGPQRASLSLAQRLPWFGTLDLRGQASALDSIAADARFEASRVDLVTRTRILYEEMRFERSRQEIIEDEQATLERFEGLARARYASGAGNQQTVVKLQAEITRAAARRLAILERLSELGGAVNALRDLAPETPVRLGSVDPDFDDLEGLPTLRSRAMAARPEVAAADAEVAAADIRVRLAGKRRSPDITVGLTYGFVGPRDDPAGEANPPQGNGDDILALSGGISLPVWSKAIDAGVEEMVQERLAAEERRRAVMNDIEAAIGDIQRRVPILLEQMELFDRTLLVQALESLRSAETAYASGKGAALDLLDAERTLYEVRRGAERIRADLAIARARLEGAIAGPLDVEKGD